MTEVEGQVREDAQLDAEAEARRRLALAQIRQYPDAALRLKAHEVEEVDHDLRRLADRMIALMRDAQGVGLAATQVGILRRLFVFVDNEDVVHALANPRILERSRETELDEEGCLSLGPVRVPVERAVSVTFEAESLSGGPLSLRVEGLAARAAQHELDPLDGVLIVQRTDDASRREALAALRPQPVLGAR